MKKFEKFDNTYDVLDTYYVGTAREITSLYKNFLKREIAYPEFCDYPKFNMNKYYCFIVEESSSTIPSMVLMSSDTLVSIMLNYNMIWFN